MTTPAPARPVLVAITTYRRMPLLPPLVEVIGAQAEALGRRCAIAVIDNDPERSAEETARSLGVRYVHEPTPGIGAARRAALGSADDDDLLVMVDDDVMPEERWLAELVATWEAYRPSVVKGWVRYAWPADCDPWISAGGFMRRDRHATGTRLTSLSTGNVLIDVADVRRRGVDFDPGQGLAGGEDTLFGEALLAAGGTIVASADSIVLDEVPRDRATVAFVRRRTIAHGVTHSSLRLRGRSGLAAVRARAAALAGGAVRMVAFQAVHVVGKLTRNVSMDAVGKRRYWFAIGRIKGALDVRVDEYARG
ncbi:MAG: glycosyltransferase [Propioniciclava sp.]|uniref:glycosyltransferase n=1 Tax=Propioniciclava sp. TaxID=2038686 RepID=UPI0039E5DA34